MKLFRREGGKKHWFATLSVIHVVSLTMQSVDTPHIVAANDGSDAQLK